jgi:hypothetical protein
MSAPQLRRAHRKSSSGVNIMPYKDTLADVDYALPRDGAFSYRCNACSRCCHNKAIRVGPYEILRLARRLGMTTTESIEQHTEAGGTVLRMEQSEYGDMTDAQIKAIQMTSLAMLAGSHGNCPSFHVIETALSEEWYDAHIFVDRPKFRNAMNLATLGPLEQMRKDPSEFCRGAWQLLGPNGLYRRQMLEAN